MTLKLHHNAQWLWDNLRPKTRNTIRRGYKNNYTFSTDENYLKEFYSLYQRRMLKKNIPPLPRIFFEDL